MVVEPGVQLGLDLPPDRTDGVEIRGGENAELALRPKLTVTVTRRRHRHRLTPDHIQTVVGEADRPVTVAIEAGANAERTVQVTLTSDNPAVASPTAAPAASWPSFFPLVGPSSRRSMWRSARRAARAPSRRPMTRLDDAIRSCRGGGRSCHLQPAKHDSLVERDVWIQVAVTPGCNRDPPVAVTLHATQPDIAVPAIAVNGELVLLFAQGGPHAQPFCCVGSPGRLRLSRPTTVGSMTPTCRFR
jgi:hypothetical protein